VEALEDRQLLATFTVDTTADGGPGSLRLAILDANTLPGVDTIAFSIHLVSILPFPFEPPRPVITPQSALPPITDPVILDGTTERGLELRGTSAGTDPVVDGLTLRGAHNSVVRGLTISGFSGHAIRLESSTGVRVTGNLIDNRSGQGNGRGGIVLDGGADNNLIGGTTSGAANTIHSNLGPGVTVLSGTGNAIRGNEIRGNAGPGIDLGGDGATANDPGDADGGPNGLQNFPVLSAVSRTSDSTTLDGTLQGQPDTLYDVQFYTSTACTPSSLPAGDRFLGAGALRTDAEGNATFSLSLPVEALLAQGFTATATDPGGNTSEFSPCLPVRPGKLTFARVHQGVSELRDRAVLSVVREEGSEGTVTVDFGITAGTATAGVDYQATSGTLTFGPGELVKTFTVPVLDDTLPEGHETIQLQLTNPGGGAQLGTRATLLLSLFDNELSDDERYITRLFRDLLGRGVDLADLRFFTRVLKGGDKGQPGIPNGITGPVGRSRDECMTDVATDFVFSDEDRINLIAGFYSTTGTVGDRSPYLPIGNFLDRAPSAGDLVFWLGQLKGGATLEEVVARFLSSAEYASGPRADGRIWLDQVYFDVLGRPRGAGETFFLDAIQRGAPFRHVADDILRSTEYRDRLITRTYAAFLGRAPDAGGRSDWLALLEQGGDGRSSAGERFIAAILTSAEYYQRNGNSDYTWIPSLYGNLLRRDASDAEETGQESRLQQCITGVQKLAAAMIYTSAEQLGRQVQSLFSRYLERNASAADIGYWVGQLQGGMTVEEVAQALIASEEQVQISGNNADSWRDRLYRSVLKRPPRPGDLFAPDIRTGHALLPQYTVQSTPAAGLGTREERIQAARVLFTGTEYRENTIGGLYTRYLGRTAPADELTYWRTRYQEAGTELEVALGILSSTEYHVRANADPF
jgi:hypothetical protein